MTKVQAGKVELQYFCNGCKDEIKVGEKVIITKNVKFLHLNCYKK